MKKLTIALFFIFLSVSLANAQDDIWYVWIDTQIKQGNEYVRLVSDEPIKITCCVKSPKFKRLQKKTAKWISANYDKSYNGENPLRNIEDESWASTVINEAETKLKSGDKIVIVKYSVNCK